MRYLLLLLAIVVVPLQAALKDYRGDVSLLPQPPRRSYILEIPFGRVF